jgi:hypothetical protein
MRNLLCHEASGSKLRSIVDVPTGEYDQAGHPDEERRGDWPALLCLFLVGGNLSHAETRDLKLRYIHAVRALTCQSVAPVVA